MSRKKINYFYYEINNYVKVFKLKKQIQIEKVLS